VENKYNGPVSAFVTTKKETKETPAVTWVKPARPKIGKLVLSFTILFF